MSEISLELALQHFLFVFLRLEKTINVKCLYINVNVVDTWSGWKARHGWHLSSIKRQVYDIVVIVMHCAKCSTCKSTAVNRGVFQSFNSWFCHID